jgi:hypothetical protein
MCSGRLLRPRGHDTYGDQCARRPIGQHFGAGAAGRGRRNFDDRLGVIREDYVEPSVIDGGVLGIGQVGRKGEHDFLSFDRGGPDAQVRRVFAEGLGLLQDKLDAILWLYDGRPLSAAKS